MKKLLWIGENDTSYLIDMEDIVYKVDLSCETVYMFPSLEVNKENEEFLNKLLPKLIEANDYYELQDIPELEGVEIKVAGDSEEDRDILCYFTHSKNIGNLTDCETFKVYKYWDGSNYKEIYYDDELFTEYKLEINEDSKENLDTWDGNNHSFRGKFNHGALYKITEIDGVKEDNRYLLETWSQWQGSTSSGEILTIEQAEKVRKEAEK
jgi:hypothetical protein